MTKYKLYDIFNKDYQVIKNICVYNLNEGDDL